MFDIDRWQEIYTTIRKHKLRTALTAFGVFWGIFMLVVLLGAGKGLENGIVGTFGVAKNAVFVWSMRTSIEYKGLKPGRFIRFTNDDVQAIRREVPEVKVLAPRNSLEGNFEVTYAGKSASFQVFGDYPDFFYVQPMLMQEGRFINFNDIKDRRKVAVIGARVKEVLFKDETESPIGKYIYVKGVAFKVVGLFESKTKGEDKMQDEQTIYLPQTTMQQAFNQINRVYWFAMTPQDGVAASIIEQKVKELLAKRHYVDPKDLKAFGSANVEEEYNNIQGLFIGIRGFSWLVSLGTILAGIIGVGNIMLIVVKERTKEIGIRKALGAGSFSIVSMILQESVVITGLSGYLGLLCGVGLVEGINQLMIAFEVDAGFFANPEVDLQVAMGAVILLTLAGALAGLMPALKAVSVNPVVALKDE